MFKVRPIKIQGIRNKIVHDHDDPFPEFWQQGILTR